MIKTYILAPNWTTAPPPNGPIKLGHILDDITEFEPLNRNAIVPIDDSYLNPIDTKTGFTTSRSKLVAGELDVFAKVLGLAGVGVGAGIYYAKDKNDILSCQGLDTMTFDPNLAYIEDCMKLPDIRIFMEGARYKAPVYLVTGLKIGRGVSLQSTSSMSKGLKVEGGLCPPGSPVEVGGKANVGKTTAESESWEGSTDFIVAFRVKKIRYRHGEIDAKIYKEKAVMQDGTATPQGPVMSLESSEDIKMSDIVTKSALTKVEDVENGEEVHWIIPDYRNEEYHGN